MKTKYLLGALAATSLFASQALATTLVTVNPANDGNDGIQAVGLANNPLHAVGVDGLQKLSPGENRISKLTPPKAYPQSLVADMFGGPSS
jgi:hypothetical protein